MDKKPIFMFPTTLWDDFSIYKEKVKDNLYFYHVSMEGYIFYQTLQDGIDYLIEIKNAYYDFLKMNKYIDKTDKEYEKHIVYKTYDIEIYKDNNGVMIFLSAPIFIDMFDIYRWLDGVIKQLQTIKL